MFLNVLSYKYRIFATLTLIAILSFYELANDCTYNDNTGDDYVGHKFTTENGYTCGNWSLQRAYPGQQFPDGNLRDAGHFCRNPKPVDYRSWCYYKFGSNRKWDYCQLAPCGT